MILPNGLSWPQTRKTVKPSERLDAVHKQQQSLQPRPQRQQLPEPPNFPLDELGQRGEEVAERVGSISARIEELLLLREEFGDFVESFDELIGAHRQARTRLAEQSAVLAQNANTSSTLRKEATDLQTRIAAADAELTGMRQELSVHQQQAQANAEVINALKLETAENASRAASLERQLIFEKDKNTALTEANAAKAAELTTLDRQSKANQREIVELKSALVNAASETARLQKLHDEVLPQLHRGKQRQVELETALHKADLAARANEERMAQERQERDAAVDRHEREKYELSASIASLNLQLDGLNNRHTVTLKHLEHARASYDENFESLKQWERSSKQATAALAAAERRLQLSEEQLRVLETQRADLEKSLADMTARNDMLAKAIAAKDAQINHLQSRASSFESRFSGLLQTQENEKLQHEAAKRKLLEQLESERAERALAQGALTIARASREKMSAQIEALKRGRPLNVLLDSADEDIDGGANVRVVTASNDSAPVSAQRNDSNG
jgi:crescentin